MEGYDIKKMRFKSKNEPKIEEKLTGKIITELEDQSEIQPNAELEGKEYIQFPDGTTQLVKGSSHAKGGVRMNIPDGSKIVSNSLKVTAKQAKQLKEDFDMTVSPKNTYSSIIDKFVKKIGLEALYNEEEELYKLIGREGEKTGVNDSTMAVNQEYLSGKTKELQVEKMDKERQKSEFFLKVFDMQEEAKPESKKQKSKDGQLKYGGVSEQEFKRICKKHGISEEQGRVLLGEALPSFDLGGKMKKEYNTKEKADKGLENEKLTEAQYKELIAYIEEKNKTIFTTSSGSHEVLSDQEIMQRKKQKKSDTAFGGVTKENIKDVMWHYYKNFPYVAEKHLGVKVVDGKITWDKDIDFTKENEKVRKFQKEANKVMIASDKSILSEGADEYFSSDFQDKAKSHLDNETFVDETGSIRGFDGKVGNFTSGRYINKVNVFTPEDMVVAKEKNIYTLAQAEAALKEDPDLFSDISQERMGKLRSFSGEGADFGIDPYNPPEEEEVLTPAKPGVIDDTPPPAPKGYYPKLFAEPNQFPTPPYPMDAHLMGNSRFQRMDPVRVGIEPQIQEAGEQRKFLSEQMFGNLPPNVAASVMANQMGNQTKAINAEARAANMTNAQNIASTELFNIGQSDKEGEANLRNKLSFEQRQYTAKANYQEEMKRWEDQIRRININSYKNNSALNLMNQMFPDYDVNSGANGVDYTPDQMFEILKRSKAYQETFGTPPTAD
jgi:hypothetical protein